MRLVHKTGTQSSEKSVKRTRYLVRIGNHWYVRIRWPKELAHLLPGTQFKRSLGTTSREEALRLLPGYLKEYQNYLDAAQARQREETPRPLSAGEIMMLVADWYREAERIYHRDPRPHGVGSDFSPGERAQLLADLKERVAFRRRELAERRYDTVMPIVNHLIERARLNPDRDDPSFWRLCETVMRAVIALEERANAELEGRFGEKSADPIIYELEEIAGARRKRPRRTISELIHAYAKAKEERWSQSTRNAYQPVFRLLKDVLGAQRDLETIDRDEARRVFEAVKQLPRGLGKRKELRGLTVPQAIKQAKRLGLPTIGPRTINDGYMSLISSIFSWAVDEQWITSNPFRNLRVVDPVDPADKRSAFTVEQLNMIFTSEPWQPRDEEPRGRPSLFWGPLIALFMGLRRGEICGLMLDDIETINGIPVVHVRPNEVRQLKTSYSRRMLPVHSKLVEMGFMAFVARQRAAGHRLLFPESYQDRNGHWGDHLSDWFSRKLKKFGMANGRLSFHSFRHSFEDALREAGLHGTAEGRYLAGRTSTRSDVSAAYGSGYSTARLHELINSIDYPGLEVGHLKAPASTEPG